MVICYDLPNRRNDSNNNSRYFKLIIIIIIITIIIIIIATEKEIFRDLCLYLYERLVKVDSKHFFSKNKFLIKPLDQEKPIRKIKEKLSLKL